MFGVFYDYATLLLELGRADAALSAARTAQAVEPDHPMAASLLNTVILNTGSQPAYAH